ncbi:phosphoribosylformylglycinamidine synthase I [Methanoplanus sp. FWC-SCC4]|uniref:Phosphoribosylformylglycinamidine synthase subunit PurQ n=1 Tax=Methanochimaera problematica TaxID=2609417 RepID=A0AA97I4I4_9EURY|nr:phosphoribosylformylglycinamidine synthase I [Methanoplanus sp. FWC-SCC4]WOF16544.1 phosphoribosylformylglycinamidine synthase I [Methanoplanus sp. FWC-SCC4]
MRFAVLQFGGSNCDRDALHVLQDVCGVDTDLVWYKDGLQRKYDGIILPGGFSYGDYLRAGAIATRTPVMKDVIRHAEAGGLVLGICNGAQIGAESGLIPGVFTINEYPKFICEDVYLRVENNTSPFTSLYSEGEVIRIPIAHKEGRYVASPEDLRVLLENNRIAFRFCDENGNVNQESNPNGTAANITGVLGENDNVLVMMPHPERASEDVLGSSDGKKVFDSMIAYIESQ